MSNITCSISYGRFYITPPNALSAVVHGVRESAKQGQRWWFVLCTARFVALSSLNCSIYFGSSLVLGAWASFYNVSEGAEYFRRQGGNACKAFVCCVLGTCLLVQGLFAGPRAILSYIIVTNTPQDPPNVQQSQQQDSPQISSSSVETASFVDGNGDLLTSATCQSSLNAFINNYYPTREEFQDYLEKRRKELSKATGTEAEISTNALKQLAAEMVIFNDREDVMRGLNHEISEQLRGIILGLRDEFLKSCMGRPGDAAYACRLAQGIDNLKQILLQPIAKTEITSKHINITLAWGLLLSYYEQDQIQTAKNFKSSFSEIKTLYMQDYDDGKLEKIKEECKRVSAQKTELLEEITSSVSLCIPKNFKKNDHSELKQCTAEIEMRNNRYGVVYDEATKSMWELRKEIFQLTEFELAIKKLQMANYYLREEDDSSFVTIDRELFGGTSMY